MGTYDTVGGTPRHDPAFDQEYDARVCDKCGSDLEWVECHMIDCEDGWYDEYEEDPINCSPGDYRKCGECGGEGGWFFCPCCPTKNSQSTKGE